MLDAAGCLLAGLLETGLDGMVLVGVPIWPKHAFPAVIFYRMKSVSRKVLLFVNSLKVCVFLESRGSQATPDVDERTIFKSTPVCGTIFHNVL